MSPMETSRKRRRKPTLDKPRVRGLKNSPVALALPWISRIALLAVVVALPWCYGGVLGSTLKYAILGVMLSLATWLTSMVVEPHLRMPFPTAMVALLAAILLGIVQFMPNPRTFDHLGIPEAPLAEQPSVNGQVFHPEWLEAGPTDRFLLRTLNPAGTQHDLGLLVLSATVFFLSTRLFHSNQAFRWACIAVGASGGLVGFLGIAQVLAGGRRILWLANTGANGSPFGPFVNRNNGGGYMNLCLAAAFGFLFWAFTTPKRQHHHKKSRRASSPADIALREFEESAPHEPGAVEKSARFIGSIGAIQLWAIALVAILMASVVASLSRGAIVSLAAGLLAVGALIVLSLKRTAPAIGIAIVGVIAFALVASFGVTGMLQKRLVEAETQLTRGGRLAHWADALKTVRPSWFLGNGFGSYRHIYRPFQDRPGTEWYYHAENMFLEALVDGGALGLGLILLTLALVGGSVWLVIRRGASRNLIFTLVATFALVTQVTQSTVDFGLYIPSNALLLALIAGAITGKALSLPQRKGWENLLGFSMPRLFPISVVCGMFLLVRLTIAFSGTLVSSHVEDGQSKLVVRDFTDQTPSLDVDRAIGELEPALLAGFLDSEGQQFLGELYLQAYRLRRAEQLKELSSSEDAKAEIWRLTDPAVLHKQAVSYKLAGDDLAVERMRGDPLVSKWLRKAYDHFELASINCPLIGAVHLRKAELCFVAGSPLADRVHLQRVQRLSSSNHAIQYRAGLLHWNADRFDAALPCWRRSLELASDYEELIFTFALQRLSAAEINARMLPDSPEVLFRFARRLKELKRPESDYRPIFARAQKMLESDRALAGPERNFLEGQVLMENGHNDEAIQMLQKALAAKPEKVEWRMDLARLYLKQGLYIEANEQARICVKQHPDDYSVLQLWKEINQKIKLPDSAGSK